MLIKNNSEVSHNNKHISKSDVSIADAFNEYFENELLKLITLKYHWKPNLQYDVY